MNQTGVKIAAVGHYAPDEILSNEDLEKILDTSDEWIVSRTGMKRRHVAAAGQATSDLAINAARSALSKTTLKPKDIDCYIVATVTPDYIFPATACLVAARLGAKDKAAFDIEIACSGFIYGLTVASSLIRSGVYKRIMLIGAETLTKIVSRTDRSTAVLFGDGAGAAILQHRGSAHGVISTHIGSDGQYADILWMPGGGCKTPITAENAHQHLQTIHMSGKDVYKQAVISMIDASKKALDKAGLTIEDIACVIPHQANVRIIEAIAERLKLPMDRFFINVDRYGNTSAAAVAIALDEANRSGRLKPGDYILMVVFGGGLTWASTVIEW